MLPIICKSNNDVIYDLLKQKRVEIILNDENVKVHKYPLSALEHSYYRHKHSDFSTCEQIQLDRKLTF